MGKMRHKSKKAGPRKAADLRWKKGKIFGPQPMKFPHQPPPPRLAFYFIFIFNFLVQIFLLSGVVPHLSSHSRLSF